jgi:alpha-glucosidase
MYVCFDNPNPMIADYPTAYDGQPGFDFITGVPTWWDETRVLKGEIGEILVTARRRGDTWYLGGMTGRRGLEMEVPLTILGAESYTAQTWQDAPDSAAHPNHLVTSTFQVAAGKPLKLSLAAGGGFVARIARAR